MTLLFGSLSGVFGATGGSAFPLEDAGASLPIVFVVKAAGESWREEDWQAVSALVHGGDMIGRNCAMLNFPAAHYSQTDRALVISAEFGLERSVMSGALAQAQLPDLVPEPVAPPRHAELARELRQLTGLSAALLGAALGVGREQFQRWMSGRPISAVRHGQLVYLHTISRELEAKLGPASARLWWHTPDSHGIQPKELLERRLLDAIHRLIVELSSPERETTELLGLLVQDPWVAEPGDEDCEDSWSPYDKAD